MGKRSKLYALVGVVSLLLFAVSCDDDDAAMGDQQLSDTQAESLLAAVVPAVLDFTLGVVELVDIQSLDPLVQAAAPAPSPGAEQVAQGSVCTPITGVDTDYLCFEPNDGVACPVDATTSEWQFRDCLADGSTLDGTVTVMGALTGPFVLTFGLTIDGSATVTGGMEITFGTTCDTVAYEQLVLVQSGISTSLVGTLQGCGGIPGGEIDATISAPGITPFVAQIVVGTTGVTVVVVDGQGSDPLYLCTCAIDPFSFETTCACDPYSS